MTARDRAEELAGLLAAEAARAESERRLTEPVMQAAAESGLFTMVVPRRFGGEGAGLAELIDTTRVLATGCPSSAWTLSFLVMHNWLLTRFPEELQQEAFADKGYAHVPAPLAPTGTMRRVEGGWEVSGRWEWATGVNHADWVMVNGIEERDDALAARFALLSMDQVEVQDVWFTSGMCATGSNTVVVRRAVVPEHRTLPAEDLLEGRPAEQGAAMAGLPVMAVLALLAAAPAVGAAERAVELYTERLRERVLAFSMGDRAAEQPPAQVRLGTATADVRAARRCLDTGVEQLLRGVATEEGATMDDRMAVRLTAADAVRRSHAVITDVCAGSGASVYQMSSPLQRLQRDVEVLKGHVVFDWDRTAELAGRVALGMPLRPLDRL